MRKKPTFELGLNNPQSTKEFLSTQSTRRKTFRHKGENRQTQPTYGVDTKIWTRAALEGGECSYCATLSFLYVKL